MVRSARIRSIALNMPADASATSAMRLVIWTRCQESHALNENISTMMTEAPRITACNSADTVKRFSMSVLQIAQAFEPETVKT